MAAHRRSGIPVRPLDFDGRFASEAVDIADVAVFHTELVDHSGDLYVEAAVFGNLADLAFAPPADGVETVGGFAGAEGGGGDVVEFEAVAEFLFEVEEEVEALHLLGDIPHAVTLEDAVIELDVIEADDEVGPGHGGDEGVHFRFPEDFILPRGGAVDDAHGHAHFVLLVPASDVARRALGFQIEVNEVFWHVAPALASRRGFCQAGFWERES